MSDSIRQINNDLLNLWKEHKSDTDIFTVEEDKNGKVVSSDLLYPLLFPENILPDRLVFIGSNPSTRTDRSYKFDYKVTMEEMIDAYTKHTGTKECCDSYFKPYWEIAEEDGFEHLDLLFVRNKAEGRIKKIFIEQAKSKSIDSSYGKQLKIFFRLLVLKQPKVIVIASALVSGVLGNHQKDANNKSGHDFFHNCIKSIGGTWAVQKINKEGYNMVNISYKGINLSIPIFFSGMLYGSRALDVGSRERLTWHIQKALNHSTKC